MTERKANAGSRSAARSLCSLSVALLLVLGMAVLAGTGCLAQNIAGQIIAAQYGQWKVPGEAPNRYSFVPTTCLVEGGASYFAAFSVGTPVRIVDGNPALDETVTPTAVEDNNQVCAITITPANQHQLPFYLTSATGGLQEAINANIMQPGPNLILLTNAWYALGGNAATIASVKGSASLGLVDVTKTPYTWYQWNGSEYVAVNVGQVTVGAAAPSGPCPGAGQQYMDSSTGSYYICPATGGSWTRITGATPTGNQLEVLGVPAGGGSGAPVQPLSLTTEFLPTIPGSTGTKVPTISAALANFDLPQDNGASHDWQDSDLAVAPPNLSSAVLTALVNRGSGNQAQTILTNSGQNLEMQDRVPFSNTNDNSVVDLRTDVPARPQSVTQFGAVCDAAPWNSVTTTAGSNQVVVNGFGSFSHNPIPGESLAIGYVDPTTGAQTAWEPIVVSYNGSTKTITTYDNAPFTASSIEATWGHDDTQQLQYVLNNYNWTGYRGTPTIPSGRCLTHTLVVQGGLSLAGLDVGESTLIGFPGEDVMRAYDPSLDSSGSATGGWDLKNLGVDVDDSLDARKAWAEIVTLPQSCNVAFTSCTVTTNSESPVQRYLGRNSIHANNPLGPGWCTAANTAVNGQLCFASVASVTNGLASITIPSGVKVPAVGDTLVFPYLAPAFETTVSAVSGQAITLAAAYPGATGSQVEFWDGNTFQTLAAALTSTATQLTLALANTPSPLVLSNVGTDGLIQIDSELISYHLEDYNNHYLLNLTRGVDGTTAAAHNAGALIVPLNPFQPARPWPINPTINSGSQTPANAEYYPAFAAGNAALAIAATNGATAPSSTPNHSLWRNIDIRSLYGDLAHGAVGIFESNIPYYMVYNRIQEMGLYWGIVETLPPNNGHMFAAFDPDGGQTWKNVYIYNSSNGAWFEWGGAQQEYKNFAVNVSDANGSLIQTNQEFFDWTTSGSPSMCPTGTWDAIYGEYNFLDSAGNHEPLQWETCRANLRYFDMYGPYQLFVAGSDIFATNAMPGNAASVAYPAVIYASDSDLVGGENIAWASASQSGAYGSSPIVVYGGGTRVTAQNGGTQRIGAEGMGAIPSYYNSQSADFLETGNIQPSTWYINANSGMIYPSMFSHQNWDAGSFTSYMHDATAPLEQAAGCPQANGTCETQQEPFGIEIEPGSQITPQTYTAYIPYKISAGTGAATLQICVVEGALGTNSCNVIVSSIAVTVTTSWQTAELDNVNLAPYQGDYIGMRITGMGAAGETYYTGGYFLMPLSQKIITKALDLAGVTGSTQCLHADRNGNVSGTGADCVSVLSAASPSLGGSAMTAGQCITAAVSVPGAAATMAATVSPVTYPGAGFTWQAYVDSPGSVTVELCALAAGTPAASVYNIRVVE